ncbi:hypothetical protein BCEN4_1440032 [Burkholderia cenocepacia]|nr:hypothetical protein BCEN4_1440032 [Burkholderia cenocepacia]
MEPRGSPSDARGPLASDVGIASRTVPIGGHDAAPARFAYPAGIGTAGTPADWSDVVASPAGAVRSSPADGKR